MNNGEKKLCEHVFGMSGNFYDCLFRAIMAADPYNREKLAKGFPEEVEATKRYQEEENYWQNLEKEFRETQGGSNEPKPEKL